MTKKCEKNNIVVRFAPAPTGYLHIGGVRTALFNYLFARQNSGKFILRIEDTDKERSKKEYEKSILESFEWLGLEYDELYRQSERTEIYKKYIQEMITSGDAYVSEESFDSAQDRSSKRPEVIRFKNPNKKIKFDDIVVGETEFDTAELGNFVIAKDLETPLYHLTAVIDDYEMKISHVIRAQEHISNTPRQILIQEAIGAPRPAYAHIPLILAPDKSKLSKRDGAVNVIEYQKMGYLADALINFLAFMGWNPGDNREVMDKKELIKEFNLLKVQKGGAVFNVQKLNWLNKKYIQALPEKNMLELADKFMPLKIKNYPDYKEKIIRLMPIIQERIDKFGDLEEMAEKDELGFYFEKPIYDAKKLIWKDAENAEKTKEYLGKIIKFLENIDDNKFNKVSIKDAVWSFAEKEGRGNVLWPMRYALSGAQKSPDPFTLAEILGKHETIERIRGAIKNLTENK